MLPTTLNQMFNTHNEIISKSLKKMCDLLKRNVEIAWQSKSPKIALFLLISTTSMRFITRKMTKYTYRIICSNISRMNTCRYF